MNSTEIRVLCGVFEGTMPDGTLVGHALSTALATPPEGLEMATRMGLRGLEMQHPGVRDVKQVGDWTETVLGVLDDDELTEETA
jgi:hypothetical protein